MGDACRKRQPGNFDNYEEVKEGYLKCKTCGDLIRAAQVKVPVTFTTRAAGAFTRDCWTEEPFCPNCEEVPARELEPMVINL